MGLPGDPGRAEGAQYEFHDQKEKDDVVTSRAYTARIATPYTRESGAFRTIAYPVARTMTATAARDAGPTSRHPTGGLKLRGRSHELIENPRDFLRRVAVAERLRLGARGIEFLERVENVLRLRSDERVPAVLHGLDPLRLVAERDAWHPEKVGFLLDAAAVRDDLGRAHQEGDEIEVVDGLDRLHLRPQLLPEPERLQVLSCPRMDGEDDRAVGTGQRVYDSREHVPVVHVAGPVQGDEDVFALADADPREDVPGAGRLGALQGDIVHHVPDEVDAAVDPFLREVVHRRLRGTEEERREVVRHDPVDLLRHGSVEGPEARLDVPERPAHLRGDERAREGRVRVSVHEDQVGLLALEDVFKPAHHLGGLAGVTRAADAQVVIRPRHVEDLEEHIGHVLVVVLPGVDEDLLVVLADLAADRGRFDELRAGPDDARDLHGP